MKRILLFISVFAGIQLASAQSDVVVISAEEYSEMKANGELEEGVQYQMEESLSEDNSHPTVYDSDIEATANRDATCDCWVEPDETYTTLDLCDDCSSSSIFLPFDFCLYGTNWSSLFINANGNVTFGNSLGTFTPDGFPISTAMVAPFWADVDLSEGGTIKYKVTDDAIYINWIDAEHYQGFSGGSNLVNNFQVVLSNGENEFLGADRNISFCYKDMQWTTGSASGGSGGFGGSPATVGANLGDNSTFIQFGRFNENNDSYDGPFGGDDGVDFLDNHSFLFNVCSDFTNNVPPVPAGLGNCDTLVVCQGETVEFNTQFLAPEDNQNVTITFDDGGVSGFDNIEIEDGDIGSFSASFTGSADNVGTVDAVITATDDGSPAASTTVVITIIVTEISIPPLEITGDTSFCGGGTGTLVATPDFDDYTWTPTGCTDDTCEVSSSGTYSVTAFLSGCDATTSIEVEEEDFFVPPINIANQPICSNDSTLVTSTTEYESYSWSVFESYPGTVYSENANEQTVYLSSGTFVLEVETADECIGQRIFNISATDAVIPEDDISGLYCDGLEEVEFFGAYGEAESGNLNLFLISEDGTGWGGGSVDIFIDGELADNFTSDNAVSTYSLPITYGQEIDIIYNSGDDDTGNIFNFTNCGGGAYFPQPGVELESIESDTIFSGLTGCDSEPAYGTWTVEGPEYEITNNDAEDNDYDIIFTPLEFGSYNLCFTDSTCGIEYCYDLEFSTALSVDLESEALICDEPDYLLEAIVDDPAGNSTISWSGSTDTTSAIVVDESNEYCISVENNCDAVSACSEVTISTTPAPQLSDTLVCNGEGLTLNPVPDAEEGPAYEYSWTGGSADGSSSSEVEATETGTYTVVVTSPCGEAEASAEIVIQESPSPEIQTESTIICEGATAELEVVGNIEGDLEWSTGETGTTITVDNSDEYCVTITNDCGTSEDCVEIQILPDLDPEITPNDPVICEGEQVELQVVGSIGGDITWSTNQSGEVISVDEAGTYVVTVTNECETAQDEVEVTVTESPTVEIVSGEFVLCPGDPQTISTVSSGSFGGIYIWNASYSDDPLANTDEDLTVYSDDIPIEYLDGLVTYSVTVSNSQGCGSSSDSLFVMPMACEVTIPNIFSPNGDNFNDGFEIPGIDHYASAQLLVFDRWGKEIYSNSNYSNDNPWTAKDYSEGTYYYILRLSNDEEYSGYVTVVR